MEFGCSHCRLTCSLLCPLVQAAPALSVQCLVYSMLAHGSTEGCQLLCMVTWGPFGEGACRAWHRAETGILVFVLPSRGNLKIAAAVQSKDTTVGEKHTFLGLFFLLLSPALISSHCSWRVDEMLRMWALI